ncbi:MAG: pseudouridine synthase [Clostridia bacterium]|nr:pseudouridine synthase [Clostridia bacterium]MDY5555479.1 pseudouridine synthase [Blautia sp.]
MDAKIRINKYLSDTGICSRREADRLIEDGRVTVGNVKAVNGQKILPGERVFVDGRLVEKTDRKVLLLFNKPPGIVCSTRQQREEMTVTDFIHYPIRIYPVGRLDKDSEGLLLMTNEGDLVNRIMRAGNFHEKEYLVKVDRPVDNNFIRKMASGVPILNTVTRPCTVEQTGKYSFRIILTQGLNRQIRRMCQYLGYNVCSLKRIRIMNLTLDGIKEGQYREITEKEWKELQKMLVESSNQPAVQKGGRHGNSSDQTHERAGQETGQSVEGILSGRHRNHK